MLQSRNSMPNSQPTNRITLWCAIRLLFLVEQGHHSANSVCVCWVRAGTTKGHHYTRISVKISLTLVPNDISLSFYVGLMSDRLPNKNKKVIENKSHHSNASIASLSLGACRHGQGGKLKVHPVSEVLRLKKEYIILLDPLPTSYPSLRPREPEPMMSQPMGPQPRELQPNDISLFQSLAKAFFKVLF